MMYFQGVPWYEFNPIRGCVKSNLFRAGEGSGRGEFKKSRLGGGACPQISKILGGQPSPHPNFIGRGGKLNLKKFHYI